MARFWARVVGGERGLWWVGVALQEPFCFSLFAFLGGYVAGVEGGPAAPRAGGDGVSVEMGGWVLRTVERVWCEWGAREGIIRGVA